MARYMPIALSAARNVGKHTPRTLYRNIAFTLESKEVGNLSPLWGSYERVRVFSTLPAFQCHFPPASLANSICLLLRNDQKEREWIQFYSSCPNINNYHNQRMFSTSSCNASRSKKGPFERSHSQTFLDASRDLKRKGSSIGQFKSNMDSDFIRKKKNQLKETKFKINRRFGKIRSSFQMHNKKISEKLYDQQAKSVFAKRLKRRLIVKRENIKTIPNLLTTLRMASAPLLSYLVISDYYGCALTIFVLAGLTDVLDGYIARNFKNQRTAFGTALDPLADKLLISFLTISLTSCGLIPVPLTVLIISRDAGLVFASFFIRYYSLAPPRTLSRYFDFSHVTAKVYPSNISKINTGMQLSYVACTLAAPVFDFVESPWLQLLMYTTAATTFLSGADYVLSWQRRLKFIKNN